MQYRKARSIVEYWNKYGYEGRTKTKEVVEAEQVVKRYKKEAPSGLTNYQLEQIEKRDAAASESWEQLQMIVQNVTKSNYDKCMQHFEAAVNAKRQPVPIFPTILRVIRAKAEREKVVKAIGKKEGVFRMYVSRAVNRIQELLSKNSNS